MTTVAVVSMAVQSRLPRWRYFEISLATDVGSVVRGLRETRALESQRRSPA